MDDDSFAPPRCNKHCAAMAAAVAFQTPEMPAGRAFRLFSFSRIIESTTPTHALNQPVSSNDPCSFLFLWGTMKNVGLFYGPIRLCLMSCNLTASSSPLSYVFSALCFREPFLFQAQPFSAGPHQTLHISTHLYELVINLVSLI